MKKTNSPQKTLYRYIGAIVGLFALIAQLYLIISKVQPNGPGYLEEILRYFSYMTIWSNILVTMAFLLPLFFSSSRLGLIFSKPIVEGGLLVYIFIVMLIYHFFLAGTWKPTGTQYLVDITLHYIVPVLYIFYWILFGSKGRQEYSNSIRWLIYPFIYILYILMRGVIINKYPYPFIDVTELGYPFAFRNMVLIAVAYLIVGLIFIIIDKRLNKTEISSFT